MSMLAVSRWIYEKRVRVRLEVVTAYAEAGRMEWATKMLRGNGKEALRERKAGAKTGVRGEGQQKEIIRKTTQTEQGRATEEAEWCAEVSH
jgi:hypothetical protein